MQPLLPNASIWNSKVTAIGVKTIGADFLTKSSWVLTVSPLTLVRWPKGELDGKPPHGLLQSHCPSHQLLPLRTKARCLG